LEPLARVTLWCILGGAKLEIKRGITNDMIRSTSLNSMIPTKLDRQIVELPKWAKVAGDEIYWTTIIQRTKKTKQVQITSVPTTVWRHNTNNTVINNPNCEPVDLVMLYQWQKTKNTAAMSLKTTFTVIKQQKNLQNMCQTWDPQTGSCPNKNMRRRASWNKWRRKCTLRRLCVIHVPNRRSECGGAWRGVQR